MLPNSKWNYDKAKDVLEQLLQEGKLQEIEPGKYKPNEESLKLGSLVKGK
jgi:hypothetical protein